MGLGYIKLSFLYHLCIKMDRDSQNLLTINMQISKLVYSQN